MALARMVLVPLASIHALRSPEGKCKQYKGFAHTWDEGGKSGTALKLFREVDGVAVVGKLEQGEDDVHHECSVMKMLETVPNVSRCEAECSGTVNGTEVRLIVTTPFFEGGITFVHEVELANESTTKRAMEQTLRTGFAMITKGVLLAGLPESILYKPDGSLLFSDLGCAVFIDPHQAANVPHQVTVAPDLKISHAKHWPDFITKNDLDLLPTSKGVMGHFLNLLLDKVHPAVLPWEEVRKAWGEAWGWKHQRTKLQSLAEAEFEKMIGLYGMHPLSGLVYELVYEFDTSLVRKRVNVTSLKEKEATLEDLMMYLQVSPEKVEELADILISSLQEEQGVISTTTSKAVFVELEGALESGESEIILAAGKILAKLVNYEAQKDRGFRAWAKDAATACEDAAHTLSDATEKENHLKNCKIPLDG
eukprot:CAMPEP_0171069372 /NCGR_PEP_ID=MMETSP0766_2-20121228/9107_1 /TAXON_ID=439317 /ORGANISM="Gambierdiscus australes, Strain CAWD 149" /LENGTH=421 /DNA_ID=CAMNT_0011525753 /DNA_START=71 /DNA_END=1336 /DNA_ORIENTATION=-